MGGGAGLWATVIAFAVAKKEPKACVTPHKPRRYCPAGQNVAQLDEVPGLEPPQPTLHWPIVLKPGQVVQIVSVVPLQTLLWYVPDEQPEQFVHVRVCVPVPQLDMYWFVGHDPQGVQVPGFVPEQFARYCPAGQVWQDTQVPEEMPVPGQFEL